MTVDLIEPAKLSDLIALIYDCAIDPAAWPVALEAMRLELGLFNSSLDLLALPEGQSLLNCTTNIPAPYRERMTELAPHIAAIWSPAMAPDRPMDEPIVFTQLGVPPETLDNNPYWREWIEPQGICDALALKLAHDERTIAGVAFGRHRDGPPIDRRTIALARLLLPHLQRAAAINRLLDVAALRESTFMALFDGLRAPIILVDGALRIVHANPSANRVMDADTGLRSHAGVLSLKDKSAHAALAAAVRAATEEVASMGAPGLGLPSRAAGSEAALLHVLPLRPDHPAQPRLAAVFVADPAATQTTAPPSIAALFGLTPGESAVFAQIAAGNDVPRTANALGVAPSTVRTHLQRVYDKTGVRRQAELVMLSLSLAMPMLG